MLFAGDIMRYEILKFENIRNLRLDNGYTQKQIAELLGISQNTYSQYEIGVLGRTILNGNPPPSGGGFLRKM